MKKFFSALFVVLFATSVMAQTGLTCEEAIPVDENYVATIDGPCTLWYTVWTYDLPLTVHFIPNNGNSRFSPEVEVDLTCTPGVYEDKKLDSLINMVEDYNVTFPLEFMCDLVTSNGKNEWSLSVSKNYREQLAEFGVPYNVQVFVKVTFFESGQITLKPDMLFKNCMNNAEYLHLGDTIDVVANDADRVFVLPYTDWQEDSIRYVWIGEQSATIYAAVQECSFNPVSTNDFVKATYEVGADAYKLYPSQMKSMIKNNIGGGLFYGKIISPVNGKLVVEKIPMGQAQGGATVLEYGVPVQIAANDTTLYCFPRTWGATQFTATTNCQTKVFLSNIFDFATVDEDANVLAVYEFSSMSGVRNLSLSSKEMSAIIKSVKDDYIYVRFAASQPTTITAETWDASNCLDESTYIASGKRFKLLESSTFDVYRLYYEDWTGYDMTIDWNGSSRTRIYISDTCDYYLSSTGSAVVNYQNLKASSSMTLEASVVDSWASRVDADGYLYVRFNAGVTDYITFTSSKPVKEDSPCVLASTLLEPKAELVLNLDKAFDIYRIDYQAWLASGVKLVWTGASPLHTFVAKDCEFAVAIYHKDVVNYTEVPAEGNVILSKDILATLGQYVDEDGYLYIRFLTELEGALTTQLAE